jgi:hypothetical protein
MKEKSPWRLTVQMNDKRRKNKEYWGNWGISQSICMYVHLSSVYAHLSSGYVNYPLGVLIYLLCMLIYLLCMFIYLLGMFINLLGMFSAGSLRSSILVPLIFQIWKRQLVTTWEKCFLVHALKICSGCCFFISVWLKLPKLCVLL